MKDTVSTAHENIVKNRLLYISIDWLGARGEGGIHEGNGGKQIIPTITVTRSHFYDLYPARLPCLCK